MQDNPNLKHRIRVFNATFNNISVISWSGGTETNSYNFVIQSYDHTLNVICSGIKCCSKTI